MKARLLLSTFAVLVVCAGSAFAQLKATVTGVPEIPFKTVPNFLKVPDGEYLGESVAVATNSKGYIYVFHRSAPTTKLWEFDANGNFRRCYHHYKKYENLILIPFSKNNIPKPKTYWHLLPDFIKSMIILRIE